MQIVEKIGLEGVFTRRLRGGWLVESGLGDTNTYAVSRLGAQIPEEREVRARYRSGDVCGSVAQTDREDLGLDGYGKKTRAEGQNATAVGGSTFWENSNAAIWSLAQNVRDRHQFGVLGW